MKGTDVPVSKTLHAHLGPGTYADPNNQSKAFVVQNPNHSSTGDQNFAAGTGVAGYIIIPSSHMLIRTNTDKTDTPMLTGKDYDAWMKNAQAEAAQYP